MTDDNQQPTLTPEVLDMLKEQLKAQVLDELKDERTRSMEEAKMRREQEKLEREQYFEKMKASPDPWVEIVGWVHTDEGVKVELEWNDAFVDYLRSNGVTGVDENQIVQKWVTLLLRDMADRMDDTTTSEFD